MTIARSINAADEYLELDRQAPAEQWAQLKKDNPYGFDVVIEATGVESLADNAINYVKRGGTLMSKYTFLYFTGLKSADLDKHSLRRVQ